MRAAGESCSSADSLICSGYLGAICRGEAILRLLLAVFRGVQSQDESLLAGFWGVNARLRAVNQALL